MKLDETVKLDDTLDEGLAGLKFEQDFENETKDLFVVVDNPEKHTTTMESYTTFRITTKVSSYIYCYSLRWVIKMEVVHAFVQCTFHKSVLIIGINSRASGRHLDTQTLKKSPIGSFRDTVRAISFVGNFLKCQFQAYH